VQEPPKRQNGRANMDDTGNREQFLCAAAAVR